MARPKLYVAYRPIGAGCGALWTPLGRSPTSTPETALLVVRHVIIFGHGHGLQRAIIDESQHRTPERLIMAQH